jgi:selenide,water dikinase
MAEGSGLSAEIYFDKVPLISPDIHNYISHKSVPGGTNRNRASYGHKVDLIEDDKWAILADPQTSGGLLISVNPEKADVVTSALIKAGLGQFTEPIGRMISKTAKVIKVHS